jgi:hypothetical protein
MYNIKTTADNILVQYYSCRVASNLLTLLLDEGCMSGKCFSAVNIMIVSDFQVNVLLFLRKRQMPHYLHLQHPIINMLSISGNASRSGLVDKVYFS